jgi:hypothetical protein
MQTAKPTQHQAAVAEPTVADFTRMHEDAQAAFRVFAAARRLSPQNTRRGLDLAREEATKREQSQSRVTPASPSPVASIRSSPSSAPSTATMRYQQPSRPGSHTSSTATPSTFAEVVDFCIGGKTEERELRARFGYGKSPLTDLRVARNRGREGEVRVAAARVAAVMGWPPPGDDAA